MKLGLLLPQLRATAEPALAVAERAEAAGAAGVFAFDHLRWLPSGPNAPVLAPFPLLAAVAARTSRLSVGTLVARVDTVPLDALVNAFRTLRELAGDRVIAAIGTGDRMTRDEDVEAEVPLRSYGQRLEILEEACVRLMDEGLPTWLAGSSAQVRAIAERQRAIVHLWEPDSQAFQGHATPVTWGGVLRGDRDAVRASLTPALRAKATWAVCGYRGGTDHPDALTTILQGAARLG